MALDPPELNDAQPAPLEARSTPPAANGWMSVAGKVLVLALSILVSLAVAEFVFRAAMGVAILDVTDWRADAARFNRIGDRAITDPLLGWTLKPHYRREGYSTLDHGFRRNFGEAELRAGGILAVGDSFTEGFDEVDDANTWPAHLEKMTGTPVVNAGVPGYATDQIILRAEQVVPIVKPITLIIGFTEVDIYRASLTEAGAPKPYFTTENGELVLHPPGPLESGEKQGLIGMGLRKVLGYSALSHHVFGRLAPQFWYPAEGSLYEEVENDPIDITCKLLARLKQQTDDNQIRFLLFLQYGGELVLEEPVILPEMKKITECAQKMGIQVVDQFVPLKALTRSNPDLVALYYNLNEEEFGQMTPKGREHAAQVLAAALKEQAPPGQGMTSPEGGASPPRSSALPDQKVLPN